MKISWKHNLGPALKRARRLSTISSTRKTVNHGGSAAESGRRWNLRLVHFLFFPQEEYFMQTRCLPSQEPTTPPPRGRWGERNLIKFSKATSTRVTVLRGPDNYSTNLAPTTTHAGESAISPCFSFVMIKRGAFQRRVGRPRFSYENSCSLVGEIDDKSKERDR